MKISFWMNFLTMIWLASASALPKVISGEDLTTGKTKSVSIESKTAKATVVVFLSAKCPCSDSHVPLLKKLAEQNKQFQFVAIHSNMDELRELSQPYFRKSALPFPVIEDSKAHWADEFKALKTPHVFVLDSQGQILYQGGVTDSSDAQRAERFFLTEALFDLSNGKNPRQSEGRTLGCTISRGKNENFW